MPSSNPLPPKENTLFKRILKCYEHKQYKNGIKFAKQILSNPKFSEHGETLAMKGLTLNCLGRKEEAYDHVRRGLRNDLQSHVCWHVYGLLQRSDKKYDEAIKCYRNALKWDKDNIQILRDLSLLQIQMRDLEGYKDTRYQLFMLRPTQRASWIGFAISYHLLKDYEMALKILDTFRNSPMICYDYEQSELLLYQNMVIQESGEYDQALKHLDKYSDHICDKITVKETYGKLRLELKQYAEAVQIYKDLLNINPENTTYYTRLAEAERHATPEETLAMLQRYEELFPRALAPRRLQLSYAAGDTFKTLVDRYLRKGLHKGVPPLFVNLRSLYTDQQKVATIQSLVLQYKEALKTHGHFSDQEKDNPREPASALLWTYYYLAQHYDHLELTEKALNEINAAIEHTPTLIELFVTKGRIYKHAGNAQEAYKWLDEAQGLDTADRYINSKCAKYMLRANLIKEAEETCGKFTREGVLAMENLNEMQCMWIQTEAANAYKRLGKYGEALKKCHEVDRHFSEIIEDQFDFHTYCMRKMTLRSYVGLLRLEDVLRAHPFYFKAAKCAVEVYLQLHDHPPPDPTQVQEIETANLTPSELKKLRNKQRKQSRKAELERQQAAQAQEKREQHNKSRQQTDPDLEQPTLDELMPEKLERAEDPLEQAIKFLQPLQDLASDRIETHLMAFEIYIRKGRTLLMLKSIKRAHGLDPNNPDLHSCVVRFILHTARSPLEGPVGEVVKHQTAGIYGASPATQLNAEFLKKNQNSLPHVLQGARMLYLLDPSAQSKALSLVMNINNLEGVTLENCKKVMESLRSGQFGECESTIADYMVTFRERFPYATTF
ncbi:PREDICTED: N-alpha-acetyltransferase 15, NatA auxiliary subunit [Dufourea novaeangliae]|uniref:N-alpha-acetyltransferase 15, NatA auxiliary subunit n=1 Tax=Dufourea novaeangliae TaxID=178035 RepID=UPI0007679724|nr:PREDICTED: N-alpha-acetyltransferase 15, NatA auxiliary subunit [Dufourea novaeangliae]